MTTHIALSALFTATILLTPVKATTILFASSPSTVYGTSQSFSLGAAEGSIRAYGWVGIFWQTNPPSKVSVKYGNPDTPVQTGGAAKIEVSSNGLGLKSNDAPYIGPTDGVVLDFSQVKQNAQTGSISKVSFDMTIDAQGPSYWTVYGYNTTGTNAGKYSLLSSGAMQPTQGQTFTVTPSYSTSTLYADYLIGVTNDCGLTVNTIAVNYDTTAIPQTPEPGTFVMAGTALIGVSVTMRSRRKP